MPQLEQIGTFLSQVVWLVVTFGILYIVLWRAALPRIADVLQERQQRIDDDLRRAETLKKEAESVIETYGAAIEKGRSEAQAVLRETSVRLGQEAAERYEALAARVAEDSAAAARRIDAARTEALTNIQSLATDVAHAAAARLLDADIVISDAEAAVAVMLKERG